MTTTDSAWRRYRLRAELREWPSTVWRLAASMVGHPPRPTSMLRRRRDRLALSHVRWDSGSAGGAGRLERRGDSAIAQTPIRIRRSRLVVSFRQVFRFVGGACPLRRRRRDVRTAVVTVGAGPTRTQGSHRHNIDNISTSHILHCRRLNPPPFSSPRPRPRCSSRSIPPVSTKWLLKIRRATEQQLLDGGVAKRGPNRQSLLG